MSFLKAMWKGNSRHKKLCEEWALTNNKDSKCAEQPTGEEMVFGVKYLGSTLVETPSNEKATAEAIKTIISMAKACGKKLQRVALSVNLQGIKMVDVATEETQLEVSIYRISYCSADATHNHVFAFITTNPNETMECHAFLCPKRKMAQAVTLTVAHSFNTVYELWQMSEETPNSNGMQKESEGFSGFCSKLSNEVANNKIQDENESKSLLIDLNSEETEGSNFSGNGTTWVCFDNDDDRMDSFNNSFSSNTSQNSPAVFSPRHHMSIMTNKVQPNGSSSNAWGDMTQLL